MRLLFKQRFFSWFDSYDIYDESGQVLFSVEGKLAWGHRLHILDATGVHVATVQQRVLTFFPQFELYLGAQSIGCIRKEFSPFFPRYHIDCNGWLVDGSFMEWNYTITNASGLAVAVISKELFQWTDTYVIDVMNPSDALVALMLVLAIDAEKCSRN